MTDISIPAGDVALDGRLTRSRAKKALYPVDSYFREGWSEATDRWGAAAADRLWPIALLVLKPEAIVSRSGPRAIAYLDRHGFRVIGCHGFTYDRHVIREAWRYQFNIASRDRIVLVDRLETATPSLLLVLAADDPHQADRMLAAADGAALPASVRLSLLKGASVPSRRMPGQLRTELGAVAVHSLLLNYVHTADEPADVVRELTVYADPAARRQLWAGIEDPVDRTDEALAQLDDLHATSPVHDLDLAASLDRVRTACAAADDADAREAVALCDDLRAGRTRRWRPLWALAAALPVEVDPWDLIVIGAELTDPDVPGFDVVVPSISPSLWADTGVGTSNGAEQERGHAGR